ncbi:MAG: hypothetical protein C4586_08460 [Anaerolineaceae bacterium]|nr:MAG: hypothetical protein C4586_08460 [Anaerolineaceae bacterium]
MSTSPHEDLGYNQPAVPRDIQKARDFTSHVLRYCSTHSDQEKLCREREGYEELHRKYPEAGIDGVLRRERRFHP